MKTQAIRKDKIKRKLETLTKPKLKKGKAQSKEAVTKKKKVILTKRAPKKKQKQNHQELQVSDEPAKKNRQNRGWVRRASYLGKETKRGNPKCR